ncbi:MAG: DUF6152 family protein [Pseudomonadales bacterium]|nr:DUF6152 family protein [Pseudomonadales bacterium]
MFKNPHSLLTIITIHLGMMSLGMVSLGIVSNPALAHHAFAAEFDIDKPVKLEGEVVMMEWVNPHSWLHIDVPQPDGSIARWRVEGGAPSALLRRGWNRNSLPPGTRVSVEGFQSRDGSLRANARDIVFPDGRKLFIGTSGAGAAPEPE